MPVLAACSTCTPLPMLSSRLEMSLARASRPAAVKKLVGLSRAELTFLPVARRPWVVASRSAVDCNDSRFWRTADVRVMADMDVPFWCERNAYRRAELPSDAYATLWGNLKETMSPACQHR